MKYGQAWKPIQMIFGDIYQSHSPEAITIVSDYPSMIYGHLEKISKT